MNGPNGFANNFPGMPAGMPGGIPGAAPGMPGAPGVSGGAQAFVLDIPADPSWEPITQTDTLQNDGYYCCRITRENARVEGAKSGVFLTLEIGDEDARGKTLSKYLTDPRTTQKNTWFVWRSIIRSITGGTEQARAAFRYSPGAFQGQVVYVKTAAYADGTEQRTGVESFITKTEYDDFVARKAHRWPATVRAQNTGGLPPGSVPTFAGAGFPGMTPPLPGAPTLPGAGPVPQAPQPVAAAPMQAPPQPQTPPQAQPSAWGQQPPQPAPVEAPQAGGPVAVPGFGAPAPQIGFPASVFPGAGR